MRHIKVMWTGRRPVTSKLLTCSCLLLNLQWATDAAGKEAKFYVILNQGSLIKREYLRTTNNISSFHQEPLLSWARQFDWKETKKRSLVFLNGETCTTNYISYFKFGAVRIWAVIPTVARDTLRGIWRMSAFSFDWLRNFSVYGFPLVPADKRTRLYKNWKQHWYESVEYSWRILHRSPIWTTWFQI